MPVLQRLYATLTSERWRAAFGVLLGMGLCAAFLLSVHPSGHWMVVPLAGTLVILYVQPHSPLAQPWPVIGSYLIACLVGFACSVWIAWPLLAAPLALAVCVALMVRLQCIHPPGAAMSLLIIMDGPHTADGLVHLGAQVLLDVGIVLLSTMLVSNAVLRRKYPFSAQAQAAGTHLTHDAPPTRRTGLEHQDLASAIRTLDTFVDIQEAELIELFNLAVGHAFGRHVGLTCADIMSRDVVTVQPDTDLEFAWNQLRLHKIHALPVVDEGRRLVGIVTVADFLRQMDDTSAAGIAVRLQGLLKRAADAAAGKARVVAHVMTTDVASATPETPVAALVAQMADRGMPHIPVLNAQRVVVGMVTQSDMLAALYQRLALTEAGLQQSRQTTAT